MGILFPQRTALGCYKGPDKVYHNLDISLHHALVETQDIASGFSSGDLASLVLHLAILRLVLHLAILRLVL